MSRILDAPSAILCVVTSHLVLTGVLMLSGRFQKTYDGFRHWVAEACVTTLGFLALFLHPLSPAGSIVLANWLFYLGGILSLDGTSRFVRGRPVPRALYLYPFVVAALQGFCATVVDDIQLRMALSPLTQAPLAVGIAALLLRGAPPEARGLYRAVALVHVSYLALLGTHAAAWLLGPRFPTLLQAGTREGLFFLGLCALDTFILAGFVLLNSQRAESEWRSSQRSLEESVARLTASEAEVQLLTGILPICACCKQIRGPDQEWHPAEDYLRQRTAADFSHRLCPDCS